MAMPSLPMAVPTQTPSPKTDEPKIIRPAVNFSPSLWGCSFDSFSLLDSKFEEYTKEVELLKEKVKDMLMQSTKDLAEYIELINLLCYLGLSYHFETEIEKQLLHIFNSLPNLFDDNDYVFNSLPNLFDDNDYDLHTLAILFRVLRQHGHKMSCDVFNKFKDNNGEFKKTITNDLKGLLSLYEASFLSVRGEDVLDEAFAFAKQHMEILAAQSSPNLAKHIRNILTWPFQRSNERFRTYLFISFYEESFYDSPTEALLRFAKLDYNRLQLLYRQELALLSRWWKDLNLMETLHYTRDRIVEAYVWAMGSIFEPQYALARHLITKHVQLEAVVDDTYDAYGTLDELQSFTAALERFSMDATDELPEYMKVLYKAIFNHFKETENNGNEGSSYKTSFAREMLKELTRGYLTEFYVLQEEQERGDCPSVVECYMNEYGTTKEEAVKHIEKLCINAWKDINEEMLKPSRVSKIVLKYFLNFARMSEFLYKFKTDPFTNPSLLKDHVLALLIDPLPV
ncbi:terpene synthase 5 [Jatropha curcas]|uniref:terpene synthase 5 n=1 Tax=Jatropha curcas TaxID=180498 RepID=UPI0018945723|nr:terpene synthase 5 [Jatropha curcas]